MRVTMLHKSIKIQILSNSCLKTQNLRKIFLQKKNE
jgi:hypothetical protein